MNEQIETQDEKDLLMEQFQQLVQEIESHGSRMRDADGDEMTPAALNNELAETVMSLMLDLADKTHAALVETRDYVNAELAPTVFELLDAQGESDEPDSMLLPEDAAELTALLMASRQALAGGIEALPEEARPVMQALGDRMERAIARISEITLEEDDGDEDEGTEEDEEDDLAEAPTEPPAPEPVEKVNGAT